MTPTSKELIRTVPAPIVQKLTGIEISDLHAYREITSQLSPVYLAEHRLVTQAAEITLISGDADGIEKLFKKKNLAMPSAYAIFTAGYELPENAILLGKYGEGAFEGFPSPAIQGHAGEVYAVQDEDKTIMILKGRAHPNEWTGETYGNMIVAHPLRVVQELIRRQRANEGVNPPVVLTYLTGVAEGYAMKPGDLGVIIDDAEGTNIVHPEHGAIELLEQYVGPHFQPKMGRASDAELAKTLQTVGGEQGVEIFPATAYGTPGTTEFQSWLEAAWGVLMFEQAKRMGLGAYARSIFGMNGELKLSPLFDMGILFELATLRQTFFGEADIRKIAVGLATDGVGGPQSLTINHGEVVANALATGKRNSGLIMDLLHRAIHEAKPVFDRTDHSIKAKLAKL